MPFPSYDQHPVKVTQVTLSCTQSCNTSVLKARNISPSPGPYARATEIQTLRVQGVKSHDFPEAMFHLCGFFNRINASQSINMIIQNENGYYYDNPGYDSTPQSVNHDSTPQSVIHDTTSRTTIGTNPDDPTTITTRSQTEPTPAGGHGCQTMSSSEDMSPSFLYVLISEDRNKIGLCLINSANDYTNVVEGLPVILGGMEDHIHLLGTTSYSQENWRVSRKMMIRGGMVQIIDLQNDSSFQQDNLHQSTPNKLQQDNSNH